MNPWIAKLFRLGVNRRFSVDWEQAKSGVSIIVDVVVRQALRDFQVISTLMVDGVPIYISSHGWGTAVSRKKVAGYSVKGVHHTVLHTPARTWILGLIGKGVAPWHSLMMGNRDGDIKQGLENAAFGVYGLSDGESPVKLKKGYEDVGRVNVLGRQGFSFNLSPMGRGRSTVWADKELPGVIMGLIRPQLIDFLNMNMHRMKSSTLIHWSEEEVFARVARNLDRREIPHA